MWRSCESLCWFGLGLLAACWVDGVSVPSSGRVFRRLTVGIGSSGWLLRWGGLAFVEPGRSTVSYKVVDSLPAWGQLVGSVCREDGSLFDEARKSRWLLSIIFGSVRV